MKQYIESITDELTGLPIASAEVFVYDDDNNLAPLFASDSVTEIDNPLTTNADGEFSFYSPTTELTALVYYGGRQRRRLRLLVGGGYSAAASASAQAALNAAGVDAYANTSLGLADTAVEETFWVDNGDGTGSIYRHDPGPTATFLSKFIKDPTTSGAASIFAGGVPTSAALASLSGGTLVGVKQSGTGAKLRTIEDELRETVKVTQFNGDDVNRIRAALAANAGGSVFAPIQSDNYSIEDLIVIPDYTALIFERGTECDLAYNGPAFQLGQGSFIVNCKLNGNGATYAAGRGVVIDSTNGKNGLVDCRIIDTGGPCVEFLDKAAGSGFVAINLEAQRYNSATGTNRYAIVIPDVEQLTAVPRAFIGLRTNGQCSIDFGGSNDTFVSSSFLADLKFSANSRGVHVDCARWANQAACTIDGHGIRISGGVTPALTIASGADNINLMGAYLNNSTVTDNSGNNRNLFATIPVSTTPVIRSDTTALTMTSTVGAINRMGSRWEFDIQNAANLTQGTDFSGLLYLDLPYKPNASDLTASGLFLLAEMSSTEYRIPIDARCIGSVQTDVGGGVLKWRAQLTRLTNSKVFCGNTELTAGWKLKGVHGTLVYLA